MRDSSPRPGSRPGSRPGGRPGGLLGGLLAASLATAAAAQTCAAVPADAPDVGSPSSVPFGNNNATDPVFSDTRYQVLVPAALLGGAPLRICDVQVAPAGSRLRQFDELTVTLAHDPARQLVNPMSANVAAPLQTATTDHLRLPTTANTWNALGLGFDFDYRPGLGDLVVEFRVRGAGAPTGSGTAGLRTSQALPYVWTTGGGVQGNLFAGGGVKLRLCTDAHGVLELGGGCAASGGVVPRLEYGGSARLGGPGLEVRLTGAPAAAMPAVLVWSLQLRAASLDLAALGAPGCRAHVFADATSWLATSGGAAGVTVPLPASLRSCVPLWHQWLLLDPAANAAGAAVSNPGRALVGF